MIDLNYQAHVSNCGWLNIVKNGNIAGTVGMNLPLEAIRITGYNVPGLGISGFAHVQDIGWNEAPITQGGDIGTTGLGKHIEAVKFELFGDEAKNYTLWYRLHVANFGFLPWVHQDEISGTVGGNNQAEAIQMILVRNDENFYPAVDTNTPFIDLTPQNPPVQNAPNVLDIARSNIGYITGTSEDSAFGRRIAGVNAGDWCCYFVVCCSLDAGLNVPITGYVPTMYEWAAENGRFTYNPQPGYYVLFDFNQNGTPDHIGFVETVNGDGSIYSIEGNTDQGSGTGVYRVYRDSYILGFVNPF